MYTQNRHTAKETCRINQGYKGETIEDKVKRILSNKEPISDGAPVVFTERKDGVKAEMNIRTDRWDMAIDAMDNVTGAKLARRDGKLGEQAIEGMKKEQKSEGNAQSTQGTENK